MKFKIPSTAKFLQVTGVFMAAVAAVEALQSDPFGEQNVQVFTDSCKQAALEFLGCLLNQRVESDTSPIAWKEFYFYSPTCNMDPLAAVDPKCSTLLQEIEEAVGETRSNIRFGLT